MLILASVLIVGIIIFSILVTWHADRQPTRRYAYRPKKWG